MDTEPHPEIKPSAQPPSSAANDAAANGPAETAPGRRSKMWLALAILAVVLIVAGIWKNLASSNAQATKTEAPVIVAVAKVDREDLSRELVRYAEFRPYLETELHAKVSGYLTQINVDFGDKVKAGQLLAKLEVPELLDELHSATAAEEKTEADRTNADLEYSRLVTVHSSNPDLVAQQDVDTARAKDLAAAAAVAAAKADVERYQTLEAYTRIIAPFDGVITKRYADPGALIQSGTSSDTQSLPVVRVSDNYRLRMDIPIEVAYVQDIHLGDPVEVHVESQSSRAFAGKVARFTDKVEMDTRTMMTEIEVDNPDLELMPGMYATANLVVSRRPHVLAIPIQAVGGSTEKTVYVVNGGGEIEMRTVTVGLETPDKYEVTSGLKEGELVMIGNRSLFHPGQKVQAKIVEALAGK
jgi:RND family efflux transporter MFP subunit